MQLRYQLLAILGGAFVLLIIIGYAISQATQAFETGMQDPKTQAIVVIGGLGVAAFILMGVAKKLKLV